ncbi:hypothetical protein BV898_12368 [Hypsibius exemplaris]|uniref:Proton-coupled folate transporter n=1 Tax=Hypsibius exemplaris TaxID=2072580 RepID=A0A1W0WDX8_HYPEX|nr:hypothetical protein BV898_12368 [Hypsibius exemplaris]
MAKRKSDGPGSRSRMDIPVDEYSPLVSSGEERKSYSAYHGAARAAPVIFLYGLAFGIYGPSYIELLKHKVCEEHYNFSSVICRSLGNPAFHHEMTHVRRTTSYFQIYSVLLECIPAIILSLFLGSWSDHFGRKKLLFFPFIGFIAAAAWSAVCAIYPIPPSYLLISSALAAICGGRFIILMAAFSFVGDFTTTPHRAMNNAIIEGSLVIGMHGGSFLGGYSYQNLGMPIPFLIALALYTTCLLYTVLFIHDRKTTRKYHSSGCGLVDLFAFHNLKESWTMLRKERIGDTRFHVTLIIMASFISNIAFNGKNAVTQLFLEFEPFKWNLQQFTLFTSVIGLAGSASIVLCVALFHRLQIRDTSIAMIAYTAATVGYIGYSVSTSSWMIVVSAVFGHMRLLCTVCIRSVLAELVEHDELGKIMALVSVAQSASPLLGSVVFVDIFALTASWWSGLCFAIGSAMLIIVLAIFAYVDVVRRDRLYASSL